MTAAARLHVSALFRELQVLEGRFGKPALSALHAKMAAALAAYESERGLPRGALMPEGTNKPHA